jgi:hypothetical protein
MNDVDPDRGPGVSSSRAFWVAAGIVIVLFLGIGAFIGYSGGIARTRGGLEGVFGAAGAVVIAGGLAMLLAIGGGVALAFSSTRAGGRIALGAAGAVIVGAVVAFVAVPVLGLQYVAPVVSRTEGSMTLVMPDADEFVGSPTGPAECWSIPDGTAIDGVTAIDLGSLRGFPLHGQVQSPRDPINASLTLSVEPAGEDPLSQPVWGGPATITSNDDGHSGSVTFDGLALQADPKMGTPDAAWPRALSGTLTWTCG